jgi:peptide/nickel transport system permease protein
MGFEPVILWTDAFIYLLLLLITVTVWHTRQHEHLAAPWRRVASSRVGQVSMVVLAFYVVIGLLDTLHYHPQTGVDDDGQPIYSTEVLSAFDAIAGPLRTEREKTYSAPFAIHLFSKENIEQPDGNLLRDYPRLVYGGAHLGDRLEDKWTDIGWRYVSGALQWSIAAMLLLWALNGFRWSRMQRLLRGDCENPWHIGAYTLIGTMAFFGGFWELSGFYHVLGTDKVGEDVFYQALKSIRTGLVIGTLTTLVMLPAAILLGIMAGYFRGWVDDVIQYLYTTLNSIPGVLLIAAAVLMMQIYMSNNADQFNSLTERADLRLLFLCLILGITSWTGLCRLLRGEALKLRELEYVQAARAFGVGHFRILIRHVLPNVMHIVLITVVLDFSGLVLAEAVLSYISIGVDPATNSWGNMINGARLELAREPVVWWSLLAAFLFMFTLVLAANLFSDVVRDAFDPRLRQQR